MSTVTGRYTNPQGDPAAGTVYISLCRRLPNGDTLVTEKRVYGDLDASGAISLDVIPSTDPDWHTDSDPVYLVEERLQGLPFRAYYIGVPDVGVDLADVQHEVCDVAPMPMPGPQGPVGPQGPQGPVGPQGDGITQDQADSRYLRLTGGTVNGAVFIKSDAASVDMRRADNTSRTLFRGLINDAFEVYHVPSAQTVWAKRSDGDLSLIGNTAVRVPTPNATLSAVPVKSPPAPATGWMGLAGLSNTGWRRIDADLINGWTANYVFLAREGGFVSLEMREVAGGTGTVVVLPLGFRPRSAATGIWVNQVNGTTKGNVVVLGNGNVITNITGASSNDRVSVSWITTDAWPGTLPGTLETQPEVWT